MRGYKEEGTTTTPFDMVVRNDLDRFHLVDGRHRPRAQARRRAPRYVKQQMRDKLIEHQAYIEEHGDDMPEIRDWSWGGKGAGAEAGSDAAGTAGDQ